MKSFIRGLFTAGDDNASMAKVMLWVVFAIILIGWIFCPERPAGDFVTMFGLLLGYALGGKASFNLGGRRRSRPETGEESEEPYDAQG